MILYAIAYPNPNWIWCEPVLYLLGKESAMGENEQTVDVVY